MTSGFGAAMVGGLADWYAVTALFRKPLHIPYRTAIIPKNRKRIFAAIITMVEEELLTADNIRETLSQAGLGSLVLRYAGRPDSRQQLYTLVGGLVREAVQAIDTDQLAKTLELLLSEHQDKVKIAPLAGQAIDWGLKEGFVDRLVDFVIPELKRMAREKYMTGFIANIYSSALNAYASRQNQRKLMGWIMENLLKLDPVTVAVIIQEKIAEFLEELYHPDHRLRRRLADWLAKLAEDIRNDAGVSQKVETQLRPVLVKLAAQMAKLPAANPEMAAGWLKWTVRQAEKLADEFTADPGRQAKVDELLANSLANWVSQNHGEIGRLVARHLESFSNEELVEYIESRVMNDLQMIRINGSVVGGITGMALFLITYMLGVGR
ncbi:DUF445 domain-containing protein [Sporomusa carbonis]|uniref:DUF445 domain-containing protein n=1 Tax=Sporomusa carbonis TaxID=3076075 RepID=UPI003C7C7FBC